MNATTGNEVLKLYRSLLRYSRTLKFTDPKYFKERIRNEFQQNKSLESEADIKFNIEVSSNDHLIRHKTIGCYLYDHFVRYCFDIQQKGYTFLERKRVI